jgi:phosphohistidine phosphatase
MLRLLLLRHAKAERDGGGRDHDRELTDRGRRDAALMGRFLTAAETVPDLVLTSSAARARATAELAVKAGRWRCPLRETAALYDTSVERALGVVRSDGKGATLLLVGHEPTWSTLAEALMGGGQVRLPTAGLAHLVFEAADWAEVAPGTGVLHGLIAPAMLRKKVSGSPSM